MPGSSTGDGNGPGLTTAGGAAAGSCSLILLPTAAPTEYARLNATSTTTTAAA